MLACSGCMTFAETIARMGHFCVLGPPASSIKRCNPSEINISSIPHNSANPPDGSLIFDHRSKVSDDSFSSPFRSSGRTRRSRHRLGARTGSDCRTRTILGDCFAGSSESRGTFGAALCSLRPDCIRFQERSARATPAACGGVPNATDWAGELLDLGRGEGNAEPSAAEVSVPTFRADGAIVVRCRLPLPR